MSENLIRTFGHIERIISEPNPRKRKKMLMEAAKKENFVKSIVEISRNVVLKNVPLDKRIKKDLHKHCNCIIRCSKINRKSPKNIKTVAMSGGWLNIILPIVASFLADRLLK